jgi:hypothetical protein
LSADVIAAVAGWIAVPIAIAKFQTKGRTPFLLANCAVAGVMSVHYALMAGWSGFAVTATIVAASGAQALLGQTLPLWFRIAVAVVATMIAWVFAWNGPASLLPLTAFMIGRLSETLIDDFRMRAVLLPTHLLWLAYAAAIGSFPVAVMEVVTLVSNVIGLRRHYPERLAGPVGLTVAQVPIARAAGRPARRTPPTCQEHARGAPGQPGRSVADEDATP